MSKLKRATIVASFSLLCLSIPALAAIFANVPGGKVLPLSVPQGAEVFTRCLAGDFDGDRAEDLAYLLGSRLEVFLSPTHLETRMTGITTCRDVAVIDGDDQDRLLVVSNAGLKFVDWVPGAAYPNCWSVSVADTNIIWESVSELRTWSRAGEFPHLFGLIDDATGPDKRVAWAAPNAAGTAWLPTVILNSNSPVDITEIQPFDQDEQAIGTGPGLPELALVSSLGMGIFSPDNGMSLLAYHASPGLRTDAIARIRMGEYSQSGVDYHAPEHLAWITTLLADNETQYLGTVGAAGMANAMTLGVDVGYYAIACGDTGSSSGQIDGVDDLVFAKRKSYGMTWMENDGLPSTGPVCGSITTKFSGMGGSAQNSYAEPLLADFDSDGDCDLAFALQSANKLWIQREDSIDEKLQMGTLAPMSGNEHLDSNSTIWLETTSGGPTAEFGVLVTEAQKAYATHVQVMAWRSDDLTSPISTSSFTSQTKVIGGGATGDTLVDFDFQILDGDSTTNFGDFIFMTVQLQNFGPGNTGTRPTRVFPTKLVAFYGDGNPDDPDPNSNAQQLAVYIINEGVGGLFDVYGEGNGTDPTGQKQGSGSDATCRNAAPNSTPN